MASEQEVKQYIAYWFQLGKKVVLRNGQETMLPQLVIQGDRYSQEFEACWQQIISPNSKDCYLEGTDTTITELLTSAWDLSACARCYMPVPIPRVTIPSLSCPCNDLPGWPNTELPAPRSPINNQTQLQEICDRLLKVGNEE